MSLKRSENKKAIDKAIDFCDAKFEKKGLWYQQDCIQGVNIMRRVVRRGVSVKSAERAAIIVCAGSLEHPGPRVRCQVGVRRLARNLRQS